MELSSYLVLLYYHFEGTIDSDAASHPQKVKPPIIVLGMYSIPIRGIFGVSVQILWGK